MFDTPDEKRDFILELTEGPDPIFKIKKLSSDDKVEPVSQKEPSDTLVDKDVHNTSMEIVETVLWGGAVE